MSFHATPVLTGDTVVLAAWFPAPVVRCSEPRIGRWLRL
jgi:hypothetical protein